MRVYIHLLFTLLLLSACGNSGTHSTDTAVSGHVLIAVDESLKPVIEAEEQVFEALYPKAQLDIIYTSESQVMKLLLGDSVQLAILTRQLSADEKKHFDDKRVLPRYSPVASDAIAVILNLQSNDTIFTLSQLTHILDGTYDTWKDINSAAADRPIRVVFDNPGSGAIRYFRDSLLHGSLLAKNCFAVEDNQKVISHVQENPGSIGLIGMSWISDRDDSLAHGFLNRIRVASLVPKDVQHAESSSMKPYQAYVALKQYPLWRTIEMINCSGRTGLGTGFASFLASDRGQRIVLKAGMVPATAPVRIIKMNKD